MGKLTQGRGTQFKYEFFFSFCPLINISSPEWQVAWSRNSITSLLMIEGWRWQGPWGCGGRGKATNGWMWSYRDSVATVMCLYPKEMESNRHLCFCVDCNTMNNGQGTKGTMSATWRPDQGKHGSYNRQAGDYSSIEMDELLALVTTWMELRDIKQYKIDTHTCAHTDTVCFSHIKENSSVVYFDEYSMHTHEKHAFCCCWISLHELDVAGG